MGIRADNVEPIMHHGLMLFGIVGNATIEVRGKLDGTFSSVIDGPEAINEEIKSLKCFLPFPFGNRLFEECGIEFEELKKVPITSISGE